MKFNKGSSLFKSNILRFLLTCESELLTQEEEVSEFTAALQIELGLKHKFDLDSLYNQAIKLYEEADSLWGQGITNYIFGCLKDKLSVQLNSSDKKGQQKKQR
jgi:hypothetical protein